MQQLHSENCYQVKYIVEVTFTTSIWKFLSFLSETFGMKQNCQTIWRLLEKLYRKIIHQKFSESLLLGALELKQNTWRIRKASSFANYLLCYLFILTHLRSYNIFNKILKSQSGKPTWAMKQMVSSLILMTFFVNVTFLKLIISQKLEDLYTYE